MTAQQRAGLGVAGASGIGEVLVSSRTPAEYRAMFALTDEDLRLRILDCPGGAASFTARLAATGGSALACDPVYDMPADQLAERVAADLWRSASYVRRHPLEYEWRFFRDPADNLAQRTDSAAVFTADFRAHPERYRQARLPSLLFPDNAFDLVLSSHLLFAYADRFDLDFHLEAIHEMVRIAAGEVRIFPIFAMGSGPPLDLDPLRDALRERGISARTVAVDYTFQRGESTMMVCRKENG